MILLCLGQDVFGEMEIRDACRAESLGANHRLEEFTVFLAKVFGRRLLYSWIGKQDA